jgi:hypothetical protein
VNAVSAVVQADTGGVTFLTTKGFEKSWRAALAKTGRDRTRVARMDRFLGRIGAADPFEDLDPEIDDAGRVPRCVRYDLGGGLHLVTQRVGAACVLAFAGSDAEVEDWLENHRRTVPGIRDGMLVDAPGTGLFGDLPDGAFYNVESTLLNLLPEDRRAHLLEGIPAEAVGPLSAIEGTTAGTEVEEALELVPDAARRDLVETVLTLLQVGDVDGAVLHVERSMGIVRDLDAVTPEELAAATDGEGIRRIAVGTKEHRDWVRSLVSGSAWQEWHLFLHPEQERVLRADHPGSAQLSGVSGAGKTCVLVRRALRLAEPEGAKVLLLTLNRSLAGLLRKLVDSASQDPRASRRIEVTSYFDLARRLLLRFEPEKARHYDDVTDVLKEHVDEVFREFYRRWANNDEAAVLMPQHRAMVARGVNGEAYLKEEFDWMRSALTPAQRTEYIGLRREGRKFPIAAERRQEIVDGLDAWERKMGAVGVVDYLGLTMALAPHLDAIEPEYTNILLDEAQDFGTTELTLVRRLVAPGPNDVFLCGDAAQTILPKHRNLARAGFFDLARHGIRQNYRNSREILAAAHDVLMQNMQDEILHAGDLEVLDPRYANFSGPLPMALAADSLEEEIAYARGYAATRLADPNGAKTACIALAGFSHRDVVAYGARIGVSVLDGRYNPRSDRLVISDLEQTKGYEFDALIIVNCRDGVLPPKDAPPEEAYRDTCRLYVAMTRARHELILSFHGVACAWVRNVDVSIEADFWDAVENLDDELMQGVPELLPQADPDNELPDDDVPDELAVTGLGFIYSEPAIGLSAEAQDKLVELVDGKGAKAAGGARIRWRTMWALAQDMRESRRPDARFGPAVAAELRERLLPMVEAQA